MAYRYILMKHDFDPSPETKEFWRNIRPELERYQYEVTFKKFARMCQFPALAMSLGYDVGPGKNKKNRLQDDKQARYFHIPYLWNRMGGGFILKLDGIRYLFY